MNQYLFVYDTNRIKGDIVLEVKEPITAASILEIKKEIAEVLAANGRECNPLEITLINWKKLVK